MFDNLAEIEQRFIAIEQSLQQPGMTSQQFVQLTRERAELEELVNSYRHYLQLRQQEHDAEELLAQSSDGEMTALIKEELFGLHEQLAAVQKALTVLLLPKDQNDTKNVILEIRAGTGGEEAGLFSGDLLRMYTRFADTKGWHCEIMSASESAKGGFKEVIVLVEGRNVYSQLKYEMGVHRVQRVPLTESMGRVHTSACTVAVLPEAEEIEVEINPADLRIDTYRSSGSGGQHVNTTDSAVRITHVPTGVVAECQDERSQHKNREKAMKMLRTRIYEQMQQAKDAAISADRKAQVGSGDRSERIRTYNFPQGRVTDHRINLTLYKLDMVMNGDIQELIDGLASHAQAQFLQRSGRG